MATTKQLIDVVNREASKPSNSSNQYQTPAYTPTGSPNFSVPKTQTPAYTPTGSPNYGGGAPATTNPSNDYVIPTFKPSGGVEGVYSGERQTELQSPLIVSQKEANALKKTTASNYYTLQSTDGSVKGLADAINEGAYASQVKTIKPALGVQSAGLYEFNLQQTKFAEKLYSASQYQSLSAQGYDNLYRSAGLEAKNQYESLPYSEKVQLIGGGVLVAEAKIGTGLVEFGGSVLANAGVQTLKEGEQPSWFGGRSIKIGGSLGQLSSYPSEKGLFNTEFLTKALVFEGIGTSYGSQIYSGYKAGGFGGAFARTIQPFSPISMEEGVFFRPETAKPSIRSYRIDNYPVPEATTRIYYGKVGSSDISGYEVSGKVNGRSVGKGFLVTETPYLKIEFGGSKVSAGTLTKLNTYDFFAKYSGTTNFGEGGTISPTSFYKGGGQRDLSMVGAEFKDQGNLRFFRIGKASSVSQERLFGDAEYNKVFEPSGKYRFSSEIRGIETPLRFNRAIDEGSFSGSSSSSGGGGGQATKMKIVNDFKAPNFPIELIPKVSSVTFSAPATITSIAQGIRQSQATINAPALDLRTIQSPSTKQINVQLPSFRTPTATTTSRLNYQIQTPQLQTPTFSTPSFAYDYTPSKSETPLIPPFKIPLSGFGGLSARAVAGGARNVGYNPSFSALIKNLRGAQFRGIETGLTTRPIPKGFRFNTGLGGFKIRI